MSKIGNRLLAIPDKVSVNINGQSVIVKGPKGELSLMLDTPDIKVEQIEQTVKVSRMSEENEIKAKHGLYNSHIKNMIHGVSQGFEVKLSLVGVGYRVQKKGEGLGLSLGYSHPVEIKPISGISYVVEGDTKITVVGIDKYLVGQTAANIRKLRQPEPYKGKGIKYADEVVRRKAGKAGKK